jgi:nucleotide-binding universal stress UspA family protein
MRRRVVVGFDGTLNARAAVARAITLAKRKPGSEIVVVCTHNRPPDFSHAPFLIGHIDESQWFREWAERATEDLEHEVARIRLAGVDARSTCGYEDPVELLETIADQVGAEYIVVPDDREGLLHDLVMGSIAKRLMQTSAVPVLAVRDDE